MNDASFEEYQQRLYKSFNHESGEDNQKFKYLVKGDLSGIQEFIFTIPSEGAARMLKARSFIIQAINKIVLKNINDQIGEFQFIGDGGGSFLIGFKTEPEVKDIERISKKINNALKEYNLYLNLVVNEYSDWKKTLQKIVKIEEFQKFQRIPPDDFLSFFESYKAKDYDADIMKWKCFARNLSLAKGYKINAINDLDFKIFEDAFSLAGYQFKLQEELGEDITPFNKNGNYLMKDMPVWEAQNLYYKKYLEKDEKILDLESNLQNSKTEKIKELKENDLIDLDHLELQAKFRTGTGKLASLKLDVDNLGKTFREKFNCRKLYQDASEAMSYFFGKHLLDIWNNEKFGSDIPFKDNILIVFSGGDDCFLLGGWDAIFEFCLKLHKEFEIFVNSKMTFSAGLIIVDAGYPIIRLAADAEEALEKAKEKKNSICLFGEVFNWQEFDEIKDLVNKLDKIVSNTDESKRENKALLQKIRLSARGYEALMNSIKSKQLVNFQKVWNLTWFILRGVKKENRQEIDDLIVSKYHDAVIKALSSKEYSSALVYPAAARWTELLTRNIK